MQQKNVHIYFDAPVSQENLNSFKESLFYYDLEFFGIINKESISGILRSNGMFHLVKAPLLKALEQSGLSKKVGAMTLTNA